MDIDDPIQQLLKTTGWSCDDLLDKLQKYKSRKDKSHHVKPSKGSKELRPDVKNLKNSRSGNIIQTLENNKKTDCHVIGKEFSDTDEEEVEIHVTHSNIIDEIIDDITAEDNVEELNPEFDTVAPKSVFNNEEQEEITEVRVIQVVEGDEDDYFEEETSHTTNLDSKIVDSKSFEYLETFPRKAPTTVTSIDLTNIDEEDSGNEKDKCEKESNSEILYNKIKLNIENNPQAASSDNTKNLNISSEVLMSRENPNPEGDMYVEKECTNNKICSELEQIISHNKFDITDTTVIYKESCEKILNVATETNNSNNLEKTFDKNENQLFSTFPETNSDQNDEDAETDPTLTNLEDIRNNLKLQLNCLRTKKKGHFLQQLSKVDSSEHSKQNINKISSATSTSTQITSDKTINSKKTSVMEAPENTKCDLYTQTNEFGLMILSVEGGIDLDEQNNEKIVGNCKQESGMTNEDTSNTINSLLDNGADSNSSGLQNNENSDETNENSGVFDEIRKIIRKQKQSNLLGAKKAESKPKKINSFSCFSRSTDVSSETKEKFNESADNSQSSFINDETSETAHKNSPFVSNTLDEFLTENSKLNISYNVPKCDAEEGLLTDSYREDSPLILKKVVRIGKDQVKTSKKSEKIKAKTVAQKRRLLQEQQLKELRKQAKNLKQQKKENKFIINSTGSRKQQKRSYIEVNNKKLWVKAMKSNICVAKINSLIDVGPVLRQGYRKKKLSLLTELGKKCTEKIKYLPGPLSKKPTLQVSGYENWETETKLLPKIILEVNPTVGKSLPPNIINRLPQCDGLVNADLTEFALSVLKTKNYQNNGTELFKFPLKYVNNQEKVIIKKQKAIPCSLNIENEDNKQKCVDITVASIIDDLIRYVEIKEIAPTLIKEEESEYHYNDSKLDNMPVIAENISSIIKKTQKKRSKVELELLRLNCKVVNVEVEENSIEESCNKPYCKLGCVCKSLKCEGMITYHCENVSCMLECKCAREKSIGYDKVMLPAGTDILSKDTVTRIEDEAKKDLAKVEREFTQMVIHTNDKTIVVGTGGRHKTRRTTKAPKKYSDYIDSSFENVVENEEVKTEEKNNFSENCFVSLEKLNLQEVVPYCLFHNLYDCFCKGKALSPTNYIPKDTVLHKCIVEDEAEEKPVNRKYFRNIKDATSRTLKGTVSNIDISTDTGLENHIEVKTSVTGRPIRTNKKLRNDYTYANELGFQLTGCARTLGIPSYMRTNRQYSTNTLKKLTKADFNNNITQAELLKAKVFKSSPHILEVDILKHQLTLEFELNNKLTSSMKQNTIGESRHKRKQIFEIRNDEFKSNPLNRNLAIQRRKRIGVVSRSTTIIEPVFDGEIIVDGRNMELLQKMGSRTVMEGYARLLPWTALITSFNNGDIKIWCMIDQPSRLLINKSDKVPPKNYIDIRRTTQTTEVILWILKNELPNRYREDHVSFILKQTKDNYEICGLCTKNIGVATEISGEIDSITQTTEINKDGLLFKHKDLNGIQQLLSLSLDKFKLQELVEENLAAVGETSIERNNLYMWAALPEIYRMCKWRMIFLNSDFTFLYFTKVKYSIKYTDLLHASNKAKEANCTVILRNSVICSPYDHSAFGIYFDSHYQDRLFIGPYFRQQNDDDIETLRYINQTLVCTESFNKMQGKTDYKCGHWLVERPYSRIGKRLAEILASDTFKNGVKRPTTADVPQINKKLKSTPDQTEKIIITQNNEQIKILDSEPRKPEEFNRYIITNIPYLGYLGAFQHGNSTEIDVSWPFENKMLRFPSVNSATDFLQSRFSSLLQPVPDTFKINIIVLTCIDLEKTKPIDACILSGHYICGEFGCYNVKTISNNFCVDKIGTTREELLRIFARRAQVFVRQKIEELADIINIPRTEMGRCDIVNILNKAQQEIESLGETEKQYFVEKNQLLLRKRELALKAFSHISVLSENERNQESWKFRQILRKQSILLPKTVAEPIEIIDSEDEENPSSRDKKSSDQNTGYSVDTSDTTQSSNNSSMDKNSEIMEITPLPRLESIKANQTAIHTYPPQRKLKSILKNKTALPTPTVSKVEPSSSLFKQPTAIGTQINENINKTPSPTKPQLLTGVKLVKTNDGKLILVSDNKAVAGKPFTFNSSGGGKQLVIRNSQILSVKSITAQKEEDTQKIPRKTYVNVPNSPPKTIILKKSALSMNTQIIKDLGEIKNCNNEQSLLKSALLIEPKISNKDTNINANCNMLTDDEVGKPRQSNPTNIFMKRQAAITDESKAIVEICDKEMITSVFENSDSSVQEANKPTQNYAVIGTKKSAEADNVNEGSSLKNDLSFSTKGDKHDITKMDGKNSMNDVQPESALKIDVPKTKVILFYKNPPDIDKESNNKTSNICSNSILKGAKHQEHDETNLVIIPNTIERSEITSKGTEELLENLHTSNGQNDNVTKYSKISTTGAISLDIEKSNDYNTENMYSEDILKSPRNEEIHAEVILTVQPSLTKNNETLSTSTAEHSDSLNITNMQNNLLAETNITLVSDTVKHVIDLDEDSDYNTKHFCCDDGILKASKEQGVYNEGIAVDRSLKENNESKLKCTKQHSDSAIVQNVKSKACTASSDTIEGNIDEDNNDVTKNMCIHDDVFKETEVEEECNEANPIKPSLTEVIKEEKYVNEINYTTTYTDQKLGCGANLVLKLNLPESSEIVSKDIENHSNNLPGTNMNNDLIFEPNKAPTSGTIKHINIDEDNCKSKTVSGDILKEIHNQELHEGHFVLESSLIECNETTAKVIEKCYDNLGPSMQNDFIIETNKTSTISKIKHVFDMTPASDTILYGIDSNKDNEYNIRNMCSNDSLKTNKDKELYIEADLVKPSLAVSSEIVAKGIEKYCDKLPIITNGQKTGDIMENGNNKDNDYSTKNMYSDDVLKANKDKELYIDADLVVKSGLTVSSETVSKGIEEYHDKLPHINNGQKTGEIMEHGNINKNNDYSTKNIYSDDVLKANKECIESVLIKPNVAENSDIISEDIKDHSNNLPDTCNVQNDLVTDTSKTPTSDTTRLDVNEENSHKIKNMCSNDNGKANFVVKLKLTENSETVSRSIEDCILPRSNLETSKISANETLHNGNVPNSNINMESLTVNVLENTLCDLVTDPDDKEQTFLVKAVSETFQSGDICELSNHISTNAVTLAHMESAANDSGNNLINVVKNKTEKCNHENTYVNTDESNNEESLKEIHDNKTFTEEADNTNSITTTDQESSIQSSKPDAQSISNLIDHETLAQVCSAAIKNECIGANVEAIRNINVSVSVTISTQVDQNTLETCTTQINSLGTGNDITLKCNSHKIKKANCDTKIVKNRQANKKLFAQASKTHRNCRSKNVISNHGETSKIRNPLLLNRSKLNFRMNNEQRKLSNHKYKINTVANIGKMIGRKRKKLTQICKSDNKMFKYKKHSSEISKRKIKSKTKSEPEKIDGTETTHGGSVIPTEIASENISRGIVSQSKRKLKISPVEIAPKRIRLKPVSRKKENVSELSIHNKTELKYQCQKKNSARKGDVTLPISEYSSEANCKQLAKNTSVDDNECMIDANEVKNVSGNSFSIENDNKISVSNDKTILTNACSYNVNTDVSRFSPSKRISNIVVHTLQPQNCSQENSKPDNKQSAMDTIIILPMDDIYFTPNSETEGISYPNIQGDVSAIDSKFCSSNILPNSQATSVTPISQSNSNINESNVQSETCSKTTLENVPPKKTIKHVSAKVNTAFTIDNSFTKKSKKKSNLPQKPKIAIEKKSIVVDFNKPFKYFPIKKEKSTVGGTCRRKELISTSDLFIASRIVSTEDDEHTSIAEKICTLAERTMKVNANMEIQMKNATLVEKCINIEDIKKKLHANICEDNNRKGFRCSEQSLIDDKGFDVDTERESKNK